MSGSREELVHVEVSAMPLRWVCWIIPSGWRDDGGAGAAHRDCLLLYSKWKSMMKWKGGVI